MADTNNTASEFDNTQRDRGRARIYRFLSFSFYVSMAAKRFEAAVQLFESNDGG